VAELLVAGVEEFFNALVGEVRSWRSSVSPKSLRRIVVTVGAAVGSAMISSTMPSFFKIRGHDLHGDLRGFRLWNRAR